MNICQIKRNESGEVGLRTKIFVLIISILIPFGVVNTFLLRNLYRVVAGAVYNTSHLPIVGGGFYSIFLFNGLMAIVVATLAVSIVFWILKPWQNLSRKVIGTLGKGSAPPGKTEKIQYAMDLFDEIDIPSTNTTSS